MSEERIVETRGEDGAVHTHTTVIRDEPARSSGGGMGKFLLLGLLVIAGVVAFMFVDRMSTAEAGKDAAVAEAAQDVGDAANQVGDAVEQGVENLSN
jgi:hypothetical protein